MKLSELAERLGCQLEGDPNAEVFKIATLESAGPGDLSFLTDSRYAPVLTQARATAVILDLKTPAAGFSALRSDQPHACYAAALEILHPAWRPAPGIHPTAAIDPSAAIGVEAYIGAYAVIGAGCRIGARAQIHAHTVLYPNVSVGDDFVAHAHCTIREGVRIGDRVRLQPGVVIGGDGFGFARRRDGSYAKIPQVGTVIVGDDVEIQANSCVDRATLESTRIGAGTKVDNLTQIGHNCQIGASVLLCAQVGIAGTSTVEDGVILAGQVGVADHAKIGAGAIITAQSGTHGELEGGKMYSGSPAYEHRHWLRTSSLLPRLTEMFRTLQTLKGAVEALQREREAESK